MRLGKQEITTVCPLVATPPGSVMGSIDFPSQSPTPPPYQLPFPPFQNGFSTTFNGSTSITIEEVEEEEEYLVRGVASVGGGQRWRGTRGFCCEVFLSPKCISSNLAGL